MPRNRPFLPGATEETIRELDHLDFDSVDDVDMDQVKQKTVIMVRTRTNTYFFERSKASRFYFYQIEKENGTKAGYRGEVYLQPRLRVGYNLIYGRNSNSATVSLPVTSIGMARI